MSHIGAGDFGILIASVLLFVALIPNWWASGQSFNAVKYSVVYFVIVLVLILVTIGLILYPLMESEAGIRALPFATPPLFLSIGFLLLLITTFELGRYDGVGSAFRAGFGLWLAEICCVVYLIAGLVKWGSRERRLLT